MAAPISEQRRTVLVASVEPLARATSRVRLDLGRDRFDFLAGQYASLAFPGQQPRDFSIASPPGLPYLDFHIRQMGEQTAAAYVQTGLRPGDAVQLAGPYGDCWWRREHLGSILCIGGGTGLAPMIAIVEAALEQGHRGDIHLYAGFQDEPDIYYEDRFQVLRAAHPTLSVTYALSAAQGMTARRTGFIHQVVAADFTNFAGCKAYLAGAPAMVEAAASMLVARGLPRGDIHADPYFSEEERQRLGLA
ncbi:FAD-binding oxidoreductase [Oceanibaculum pacificum]|uniref:FAD-binding oxidoreductase n=1 Tax=Oceanibaculum pacificum TaxID=580166 RepID=UPI0009FD0BFD|nr:hypothetical protein [Oceanibaculum pacificum]